MFKYIKTSKGIFVVSFSENEESFLLKNGKFETRFCVVANLMIIKNGIPRYYNSEISVLNPEDTFSFKIGAKLALARLLEEEFEDKADREKFHPIFVTLSKMGE